MSLVATITAVTTDVVRRAGQAAVLHMRDSTKGVGRWNQHRVIWRFTSYPAGFAYTATDPRDGALNGSTLNLRDGDFEGFTFGFFASHVGTYTIEVRIIDAAGNEDTDTITLEFLDHLQVVTLAADGSGDYTTWSEMDTALSLQTNESDRGLKVVIKSGSYDTGARFDIWQSTFFEWDGVGEKPTLTGTGTDIFRFRGNGSSIKGVNIRSSFAGTPGGSNVCGWFDGRTAFVDCDFGRWKTNGTLLGKYGGVSSEGVLIYNCTGLGNDTENGFIIGETFAGNDRDIVWVNNRFGPPVGDLSDTSRSWYAQSGLFNQTGITCIADYHNSKDDASQTIRLRGVNWVYFHRCHIRNGISSDTFTDETQENVRIQCCDLICDGPTTADVAYMDHHPTSSASGVGFFSCMIRPDAGECAAVYTDVGAALIEGIGYHACTFLIRGARVGAEVDVIKMARTNSQGGNLEGCLFVDDGEGSFSWRFFELESTNFNASFTDNTVPVMASRPFRAAFPFYYADHPDGSTNDVAVFNTYTGVSGTVEEAVSLDANFVSSSTRVITTPAGVHVDYYGNPVGSNMTPGAIQDLPQEVSPTIGNLKLVHTSGGMLPFPTSCYADILEEGSTWTTGSGDWAEGRWAFQLMVRATHTVYDSVKMNLSCPVSDVEATAYNRYGSAPNAGAVIYNPGDFYWRCRYQNRDGSWSAWAESEVFTVTANLRSKRYVGFPGASDLNDGTSELESKATLDGVLALVNSDNFEIVVADSVTINSTTQVDLSLRTGLYIHRDGGGTKPVVNLTADGPRLPSNCVVEGIKFDDNGARNFRAFNTSEGVKNIAITQCTAGTLRSFFEPILGIDFTGLVMYDVDQDSTQSVQMLYGLGPNVVNILGCNWLLGTESHIVRIGQRDDLNPAVESRYFSFDFCNLEAQDSSAIRCYINDFFGAYRCRFADGAISLSDQYVCNHYRFDCCFFDFRGPGATFSIQIEGPRTDHRFVSCFIRRDNESVGNPFDVNGEVESFSLLGCTIFQTDSIRNLVEVTPSVVVNNYDIRGTLFVTNDATYSNNRMLIDMNSTVDLTSLNISDSVFFEHTTLELSPLAVGGTNISLEDLNNAAYGSGNVQIAFTVNTTTFEASGTSWQGKLSDITGIFETINGVVLDRTLSSWDSGAWGRTVVGLQEQAGSFPELVSTEKPLNTVVTVRQTTATKRVGCLVSANMRNSDKGEGQWVDHRVVWDMPVYPEGFTYTVTDPRPGLQNGEILNLRDGDYEGYTFVFNASVAGDYTVRCTITDRAGNVSSATSDTITIAAENTYTSEYIVAPSGGDYTSYGAAVAAANSAGGNIIITLQDDGTYAAGSSAGVSGSNILIRRSNTGTNPPVVVQSTPSNGLSVLVGAENVSFIGIDVDPSGSGNTFNISGSGNDPTNDTCFMDCRIISPTDASNACTFAWRTKGAAMIRCDVHSNESSNELFNGQFAFSDRTTDVGLIGCRFGVTGGAQIKRCVYDLGTLGLASVATHYKSIIHPNINDIRDCVRLRRTGWSSNFRDNIDGGLLFSNQLGGDLSTPHDRVSEVPTARRCFIRTFGNGIADTVNYAGNIPSYNNWGWAGVTGVAGVYSCILEYTSDNSNGFKDAGRDEDQRIQASGNTMIVNMDTGSTNVGKLFRVGTYSEVSGFAVVKGSSLPDEWQFVLLEDGPVASFRDVILPDSTTVTAQTSFYFEDGVAIDFNEFISVTNVEDVIESTLSYDNSTYVPVNPPTFTTTGGEHQDYYGNPVGSTAFVGAVQGLPDGTPEPEPQPDLSLPFLYGKASSSLILFGSNT